MEWEDIQNRKPLYLNIGGFMDCDPRPNYENYVSVDMGGDGTTAVKHDMTKPLPLADDSVDHILTEHFLEHVSAVDLENILNELYRVLKPGGLLRAAVPDYNHPRDIAYLRRGHDPRHADHLILPTYTLLRDIVAKSKFKEGSFYHYWHEGVFHYSPVDYSKGHIKRTPDNDPRCKMPTQTLKKWEIYISNFFYKLKKRFKYTEHELLGRRGSKYGATSILFDLNKPK